MGDKASSKLHIIAEYRVDYMPNNAAEFSRTYSLASCLDTVALAQVAETTESGEQHQSMHLFLKTPKTATGWTQLDDADAKTKFNADDDSTPDEIVLPHSAGGAHILFVIPGRQDILFGDRPLYSGQAQSLEFIDLGTGYNGDSVYQYEYSMDINHDGEADEVSYLLRLPDPYIGTAEHDLQYYLTARPISSWAFWL